MTCDSANVHAVKTPPPPQIRHFFTTDHGRRLHLFGAKHFGNSSRGWFVGLGLILGLEDGTWDGASFSGCGADVDRDCVTRFGVISIPHCIRFRSHGEAI